MADGGHVPSKAFPTQQRKALGLTASEKAEMYRPIVFVNHQWKFKVFTALVSAGLTYYFVFSHDFGEKEHCFSWIRRWKETMKMRFFHLSPADEEQLLRHSHSRAEEQQPTPSQARPSTHSLTKPSNN